MQHECSAESADRDEKARKHILCSQHRPGQRVSEHAGKDGMRVCAKDGTHEERFPQSAHPVFKGAHVVAHVLTPGEPEANKRAKNATLRRAIEHLTRSENQRQNTNSLTRLFHDGTREHGRHEINRFIAQVARLDSGVNDAVAVSRKDQRATGSPAECCQPGQHGGLEASGPREKRQAHDCAERGGTDSQPSSGCIDP